MIKKILSAVLALTLAAALLIGCDREEKEDGKKDDSGKAESYYVPTKMKMAQGDQEQSAEITWENNAFHVYVEADNTKTHMMCVEFDSKGNYTKEVEYNETNLRAQSMNTTIRATLRKWYIIILTAAAL